MQITHQEIVAELGLFGAAYLINQSSILLLRFSTLKKKANATLEIISVAKVKIAMLKQVSLLKFSLPKNPNYRKYKIGGNATVNRYGYG